MVLIILESYGKVKDFYRLFIHRIILILTLNNDPMAHADDHIVEMQQTNAEKHAHR